MRQYRPALAIIPALILCLGLALDVEGQPAYRYEPYEGTLTEVIRNADLMDEPPSPSPLFDDSPADDARPSAAPTPTPKPSPRPRATQRPRATPKPRPQPIATSHSLRGLASWYCSPSQPVCHHAYPPGSMVAAACGKLRIAMGGHADRFWRGKVVTVRSGDRQVTVKLVDWCGSKTKTIDLYWEPIRRLGGSGVLPVVVKW